MTWFKVDDRFPESDKVIELMLRPEGLAALGVWTLCGAWAAGRGNGGRITEAVVKRFRGTKKHVAALVSVGLWDASDGDWQFHDWDDYNESAEAAEAVKVAEREAGRRGNHERWHVKRGVVAKSCPFCVGYPTGDESGGNRVPDASPDSGAIPPGPGPDPDPEKTDHGDPHTSVPEGDARDDDDLIKSGLTQLGIGTPTGQRRALNSIRAVIPTVTDAEAVDVARAILTEGDALRNVAHPVPYVEKACRSTPSEVLGLWQRMPRVPVIEVAS